MVWGADVVAGAAERKKLRKVAEEVMVVLKKKIAEDEQGQEGEQGGAWITRAPSHPI